jgi:7-carboxy-7-deazaguanine synthase
MTAIDPNKLLISSDFYSCQGEGKSTGVPSYFIRLGLCNLACGMSNRYLKKLIKEQTLEDGEIFKGDLEVDGKATWTCDSTSQWAWRGENQEFQYLIDRWKEQGLYEDIMKGVIHLIWTGGEPAMVKHQEAILNFLEFLYSQENMKLKEHFYESYGPLNFHELETNGTVYLEDKFFYQMSQINCSPKLSNSGMTEKQRIVPEAIERIMRHHNYQFKFVISTENDVKELFRDFVEPFNIPLQNVVCMPGLDDQDDFHERTQFCLEMAKKYRFTGMTRLHISAWDRTLNV